jgi:hypothetical protein
MGFLVGEFLGDLVLEETARDQGRAGYVPRLPLVRLAHVHHVHVLFGDQCIVDLLYARLLRFGLLLGHLFLEVLRHLTTFPASPS